MSMQFDAKAPICDGIPFDDLHLIESDEIANMLCARGLVWLTDFEGSDGKTYGGSVLAASAEAATQIAFGRGLGEIVIGPALSRNRHQ